MKLQSFVRFFIISGAISSVKFTTILFNYVRAMLKVRSIVTAILCLYTGTRSAVDSWFLNILSVEHLGFSSGRRSHLHCCIGLHSLCHLHWGLGLDLII